MLPLPSHFVSLSTLEYGYQRHEALGAAISTLGSLPTARDESKTKSGACRVMLPVGFVCSFPRQTRACLPASPSPSRFPERDSRRGSGYQRKVPNSLFDFVSSVKRSDVGRRLCFHRESLEENKTNPTPPPIPGPPVPGFRSGPRLLTHRMCRCWSLPVGRTTSPPALWDSS